MGTLLVNILLIEYIGLIKPMTSRFENQLDLLNEFLIHILVMYAIIFTDYVEDLKT